MRLIYLEHLTLEMVRYLLKTDDTLTDHHTGTSRAVFFFFGNFFQMMLSFDSPYVK